MEQQGFLRHYRLCFDHSAEPKIFIDPVPLIFYEEEYDAYLEHCRTDPKVPENFIRYDSLLSPRNFSEYPISDESPSIIQAFLSLDTADEAVARFAEMISQP